MCARERTVAYITKACCYLHNMGMPNQPFVNSVDFQVHLRLLLDEAGGDLEGPLQEAEDVVMEGTEEAIRPHGDDVRTMVASTAYEAYRENQLQHHPDDVDLSNELKRARAMRCSFVQTNVGKVTKHYVLH